MASAVVHSKVVVLLFVDSLFYYRLWIVRVTCLVFVSVCISLCPFKFGNHLEESWLVSFNIVFLMYCDYKCSVALPRSAVCWSAVCDSGIF